MSSENFQVVLDAFREKTGYAPRHNGGGEWQARCTSHVDGNPSVSLRETDDGKILIHDHGGCDFKTIQADLDLPKEVFRSGKGNSRRRHPEIIATYDYTDEAGSLVFQVVRLAPKSFRQRRQHPDNKGQWMWGLSANEYAQRKDGDWYIAKDFDRGPRQRLPQVDRPLYNLPAVLKAIENGKAVFLVEGEEDVESVRKFGLPATTSAGGAGKWNRGYSAILNRAVAVVIIPDNDLPGIKHAWHIHSQLDNAVVLQLPDLPEKGDVSDWIASGGTRKELVRLAQEAIDSPPSPSEPGRTDEPIRHEIPGLADEASPHARTHHDGGDALPAVFLPDGAKNVRVNESASELGRLISKGETVFSRGDSVVQVHLDASKYASLKPVKPAALTSILETVAELLTTVRDRNSDAVISKPKNCSENQAKRILSCAAFIEELPPLRLLTRCPVLTEHRGQLVTVTGYHRDSGIYALGGAVTEVLFDEACHLLVDLVSGFEFASPADLSRALAAILTPALIHGQLLRGRAPLDLGEADKSQTGKGYRARLIAAIYNDVLRTITQRKGGVGGLEESLSSALLRGACFINFDNFRGRLDSPGLESALTEDFFPARALYQSGEIDMRRIFLLMTSNKAELTPDLANRASPVELRKQPDGYEFKTYAGGADILEHVKKDQPRYLGAVFTIVREWHARGCPKTSETRHDFRPWAQSLDWIVQNLMGAAPLCDGLGEVKARMTSPDLTWLRDVALQVSHIGREGDWLRASQIVDLLDEAGAEIPGIAEGDDLSNDEVAKKAQRAVGRKLGKCFSAESARPGDDRIVQLDIDTMLAERRLEWDQGFRKDIKKYRFSRAPIESGAMGADLRNGSPQLPPPVQSAQSQTVENGLCAHTAPIGAPMDAPIESLIAPIAPIGGEHCVEEVEPTVRNDNGNTKIENNRGPMGAWAQPVARDHSDEAEDLLGSRSDSGHEPSEKREVFDL